MQGKHIVGTNTRICPYNVFPLHLTFNGVKESPQGMAY